MWRPGEFVAVMDADLQDPPSLLPRMFDMLTNDPDIDCIATRRTTRAGEPPIRSAFSRLFYHVMNMLSPVEVPDGARDFRMMRPAHGGCDYLTARAQSLFQRTVRLGGVPHHMDCIPERATCSRQNHMELLQACPLCR